VKPTREEFLEWRRFIAEHFDSASIQQRYAYQATNAAEGASTYFEVESKTGKARLL